VCLCRGYFLFFYVSVWVCNVSVSMSPWCVSLCLSVCERECVCDAQQHEIQKNQFLTYAPPSLPLPFFLILFLLFFPPSSWRDLCDGEENFHSRGGAHELARGDGGDGFLRRNCHALWRRRVECVLLQKCSLSRTCSLTRVSLLQLPCSLAAEQKIERVLRNRAISAGQSQSGCLNHSFLSIVPIKHHTHSHLYCSLLPHKHTLSRYCNILLSIAPN